MEPFKNLLNVAAAHKIATAISRADTSFSSKAFLKNIEAELEPLELKSRMLLLKNRLKEYLPDNPEITFPLLTKALKQSEPDSQGLSGFLVWPLTQFIAEEGLEHFDLSMQALYQMTQVFTAEFAVRPFFIHHEKKTLQLFHKWALDKNHHVRRLVSEGSRPLLPWGQRLPRFVADPELTWPLLEKLKWDESDYVRKSVANHINDHTKHHPDWVLRHLQKWHQEAKGNSNIHWIIRHGSRTLIKKCHPKALKLQGISSKTPKVIQATLKTKKIQVGGKLEATLKLNNPFKSKLPVLLDYQIHFLKKNGQTSPKVFKGLRFELAPGETKNLSITLPIRHVTTRTYYEGRHAWTPLINGQPGKSLPFQLIVSNS